MEIESTAMNYMVGNDCVTELYKHVLVWSKQPG